MAWEKRKNKTYYYRKRRVKGRVVSEYLGRGELAELDAHWRACVAAEKQQMRAEFRALQQEIVSLEQELDRLHLLAHTLTRAALIASGYHTHKGQWRRQRKTDANP